MHTSAHRSARLTATIATALLLAACGGDAADTAPSPRSASPSRPATVDDRGSAPPVALEGEVNDRGTETVTGDGFEVELDDFAFSPTFLKGEPGQSVRLELRNAGSASHTFTIDDQDLDAEVEPGATTTVEVTFPDTGSVRFYCRFHALQGMQGALFTGASRPDSGPSATPT